MGRGGWKGVIDGKEEERNDKGRECDRAGNLHHAFGLIIRSQKFIAEEAVEDMSYENLKFLSLAPWRNRLRLDAE